ncbi:hypothetical protein C8R43DRAFT_210694 [Mycena crocata]|nr:hypothetical protein C8R43DRAFT_210694 [Mycena crocata]
MVCKDLSIAVDPLFFSAFVLKSNRLHLQNTIAALEAIAKGKTGWSSYAKTLVIKSGKQPQLEAVADMSIAALTVALSAALGSLINIRAVGWEVDDTHPLWALKAVCGGLNSLPFLDDLQLSWWPTGNTNQNLPLTALSGLRRLTAKSRYRNPTLGADQMCSLVHQNRGLASLHLLGGDAAWWPEVWMMLREQSGLNIRLTDICTDAVTSDLLAYLASYSGLESLQFRRLYAGNREQADKLADIFYNTVLPRHAETLVCLRDLDSLTSNGARWSFGRHNVDVLLQLQRVQTLELCVNASEVLNVAPANNTIDLLLRTAPGFPALRILSIWYHWYSGSPSVGSESQYLPSVMNPAVKATVQDFRTCTPSAAVVLADHRYYTLAPVHSDDKIDARAEAEPVLTYRPIEVEWRVGDCGSREYLV